MSTDWLESKLVINSSLANEPTAKFWVCSINVCGLNYAKLNIPANNTYLFCRMTLIISTSTGATFFPPTVLLPLPPSLPSHPTTPITTRGTTGHTLHHSPLPTVAMPLPTSTTTTTTTSCHTYWTGGFPHPLEGFLLPLTTHTSLPATARQTSLGGTSASAGLTTRRKAIKGKVPTLPQGGTKPQAVTKTTSQSGSPT